MVTGKVDRTEKFALSLVELLGERIINVINPNYNKIFETDWLSASPIRYLSIYYTVYASCLVLLGSEHGICAHCYLTVTLKCVPSLKILKITQSLCSTCHNVLIVVYFAGMRFFHGYDYRVKVELHSVPFQLPILQGHFCNILYLSVPVGNMARRV